MPLSHFRFAESSAEHARAFSQFVNELANSSIATSQWLARSDSSLPAGQFLASLQSPNELRDLRDTIMKR